MEEPEKQSLFWMRYVVLIYRLDMHGGREQACSAKPAFAPAWGTDTHSVLVLNTQDIVQAAGSSGVSSLLSLSSL